MTGITKNRNLRNIFLLFMIFCQIFLFFLIFHQYDFNNSNVEDNEDIVNSIDSIQKNKQILSSQLSSNYEFDWVKDRELYEFYEIAKDNKGNLYTINGWGKTYRKFNSNLSLVWSTSWNEGDYYDISRDIALDPVGNIYIIGDNKKFSPISGDIFILKYNSSGFLNWSIMIDGPEDQAARGITCDNFGNFYVVGHIDNKGILFKYNPSGSLLWNRIWDDENDHYANDIIYDNDTGIYITGHKDLNSQIFLLKYDLNGDLQWYRNWGSEGGYEDANKMVIDSLGDIYIVGKTSSYKAYYYDLLLLKYSPSGDLLWYSLWGGEHSGFGNYITCDKYNNLYLTGGFGYSYSENGMILLKYSPSGILESEIIIESENYLYGSILWIDNSHKYLYVSGWYLWRFGPDNDYDKLSDWNEINTYYTDPNNPDSDNDGLIDGDELQKYHTDPNKSDTDGDGINDGHEIDWGTDPINKYDNLLIRILCSIIIISAIIIIIAVTSFLYKKFNLIRDF